MTVYGMLPKTGPTHDLATVIAWSVQMGVIFVAQTFCKETNYMLTERQILSTHVENKYHLFICKIKTAGLIKLCMVCGINLDNAQNK